MKKFISLFAVICMMLTSFTSLPVYATSYDYVASGNFNGHTYYVFDDTLTWEKAKEYCESIGGYLAVITSEEENEIVTNLIKNTGQIDYFIGATDEENEGSWRWITGEAFVYTNWNSGEPNNSNEEDYLSIAKSSCKWNDLPSTKTGGFICEINRIDTRICLNNKYQLIENESLSWEEANYYCQKLGGHLATITSHQEQLTIENLISKGTKESYFLGGIKSNDGNSWNWVTGETFYYTHWGSGEPNNTLNKEKYIEIVREPWGELKYGYWNDIIDTNRGFICEWDNINRASVNDTVTLSVMQNNKDMRSSDDDYEICPSAQVKVNGKAYPLSSAGTVTVPASGTASVSCDGYYPETVALSGGTSYKKVYLEKSGMNVPVLRGVTLSGEDIRRSSKGITSDFTGSFAADIDWNGNTEKIVYIDNGVTRWLLTNSATGTLEVGKLFNTAYDAEIVIKTGNGYEVKKKLHIDRNACSSVDADGIDLSFGDKVDNIGSGNIPYLKMKFGFDIPNFPIEVYVDGNKFKAVVGVDMAYYEKGSGETKAEAFDSIAEKFKNCGKRIAEDKKNFKDPAEEYKELKKDLGKSLKVAPAKFAVDASLSLSGYLEGTIDQNGLYLSDSGLIVAAEAKASLSGEFMVWVIPCNWEASLKGTIEAQLALFQKEVRSKKFGHEGTISGSIKLAVGVGPGFKDLHADICGSGELKAAISADLKDIATTLDAEVALYIEAKAWKFSHEFTLAEKEFHLYPQEASLSEDESEQLYDPAGYKLIGREYLQMPSEFVANDVKASLMSEAPATKVENVIKSNAYKDPSPKLISLGNGKQLLVWVDDDTSRSTINGTSLAYSIYDGTKWSAPQYVESDGTADFDPQLKEVNGTVYLVWENTRTALADDAQLADMEKAMEIRYAVFDAAGNTFTGATSLTDNTLIDMSPVIGNAASGAVISWISDTSGDIFSSGSTRSIMYAKVNGSTVSQSATAAASLPPVDSHVTYDNAGTVTTLYIADTDGNIQTSEDNELYSVTAAATTRMTNDALPQSGISEYFGKYYMYDNGYLSISADGTNFTKTSLAIPNDKFTVVDNGNMICFESGTDAVRDIYAYIYDSGKSTWGNALQLTDLSSNLSQVCGFTDTDGKTHFAFNKANVTGDFTDNIGKLFNKYDISTLTVEPSYNITVSDVYLNKETLVPGSAVSIEADVKNSGEKTVDSVKLSLADAAGTELTNATMTDTILPGETKTETLYYTIPETFAPFTGTLTASIPDKTDYDTTDNSKTQLFDYKDLRLAALSSVKASASSWNIVATVSNLCTDTQSNIAVTLKKDGTAVDTKTVSSLAPLENTSVSFENVLTDTEYTVEVAEIADEDDLADNSDTITVTPFAEDKDTDGYIKEASYADGVITAEISMFKAYEASNAYLALFDSTGKLVAIKSASIPVNTESKEMTINHTISDDGTYTLKLMLWDNKQEPFMEIASREISAWKTKTIDTVLESPHQYTNNYDNTQTYTYDGTCTSIDVTFSSDTQTESGYDYIYILDKDGNQIGKYSGTALASKTINVPGNTVKIRLTSDGSNVNYGYRTASIVVNK